MTLTCLIRLCRAQLRTFFKMTILLQAIDPRSSQQLEFFKYMLLLLKYNNICAINRENSVKMHR